MCLMGGGTAFTKHKSMPSVWASVETGVCGLQGLRDSMEDAHISMPSFLSSSSKLVDLASSKSAPLHFFGVLDGHGGEACAEYCGDALPKQLKKSLSSGLPISASLVTAHAAVEVDWFREADRDDSGTTAVTALIESASGRVLASNVGDSRVLVVRRSGKSGSKVVALTR